MPLAPTLARSASTAIRPLAGLVERLRTSGGAFALHETGAAARPYLLAELYKATARQTFVVVPTADVAERTFADLLYYLGESEAQSVALMRPRDENIGALESPSERSARMSLLAQLCAGQPLIVVAPVAALRQYLMPRALFESSSFALETGRDAGFEATQTRLFRLGYHRVDVVSAAGEYAVRGGLIDLFAATAERPTRIEFFGDEV
ncbi:MAG TPA: hypothetical protein VKU84_04415, partial [Stellaceae bacterium]|nr:hypothetical protein [Stellaceae bacterium]